MFFRWGEGRDKNLKKGVYSSVFFRSVTQSLGFYFACILKRDACVRTRRRVEDPVCKNSVLPFAAIYVIIKYKYL